MRRFGGFTRLARKYICWPGWAGSMLTCHVVFQWLENSRKRAFHRCGFTIDVNVDYVLKICAGTFEDNTSFPLLLIGNTAGKYLQSGTLLNMVFRTYCCIFQRRPCDTALEVSCYVHGGNTIAQTMFQRPQNVQGF